MRMKRWESPRREGRNHKGKKSSARQRQIKKQTQVWRKKLKGNDGQSNNSKKERHQTALFLWARGSHIYRAVTFTGRSHLSVSYHGRTSLYIIAFVK